MKLHLGSLRARLLAIVMTTTLVAVAVALLGNVAGNAWNLHEQNVADLHSQAELVGRMTSPALVFADPDLASHNLAQFETRPRIHAAAIYDEDGRLFADYVAKGRTWRPPREPGPEGARLEGRDVVVVRPISQAGAVVGTVYLRGDAGIGSALARSLVMAVIGGAMAMLAAYLMVRRLERVVTQPIGAVASAAREVVRERDYSRRVARLDDDDFGELVDAFNAMLAEVESRTEQLRLSLEDLQREAEERRTAQEQVQRLNEDLERRVAARTQDLEHSNHELTLAKSAADEASSAKSNFLATMSHEIRTPMNGVIGMIDVLQQSSLRGDQVEMTDLIRDSAHSLLTIIDDILDFSKIEAGRMEVEEAPFPVREVVERACALLDQIAIKREVELTCFVDPALPALLLGDALRLRQVVVNLVNNAIKFSSGLDRPGRVAVRAECVQRAPGRVRLRISVIDNGIGMDESVVARLFSAFTQADSSTTRRFGGSGLGLAISHRLVGLMGGQLEVQSDPGRGSRFSASVLLAELPPGVAGDRERVGQAVFAGLRCLVVGGTDGLSRDLAIELRAAGAQVDAVDDAGSARRRLAAALQPWHVVVVDAGGSGLGDEVELALAEAGSAGQLVIGRGPRRIPQRTATGRVEMDGNVLTHRRLMQAIAMAAGRQVDEVPVAASAGPRKREAPDRALAMAQGQLILVAEDNQFNQQVVMRQLAVLGCAADLAQDGQQAWDLWQSDDYGLLLTDLHMPGVDGYELTGRIRAAEPGATRMPIIALTANALDGEAERCLAAGMDAFLSKPVVLGDLDAMLSRWLPARPAGTPGLRPENPDPVPLSIEVLRGYVSDDPVAETDFLRGFRANATRLAARIQAAWQVGDLAGMGGQAHALKASARLVGAVELARLCEVLESAGGAGDATRVGEVLGPFHAVLASAVEHAGLLIAPER